MVLEMNRFAFAERSAHWAAVFQKTPLLSNSLSSVRSDLYIAYCFTSGTVFPKDEGIYQKPPLSQVTKAALRIIAY